MSALPRKQSFGRRMARRNRTESVLGFSGVLKVARSPFERNRTRQEGLLEVPMLALTPRHVGLPGAVFINWVFHWAARD
jgi:hypothetical protein